MHERETDSGIPIKPVYAAGDVDDLDLAHQPLPGEYPYTRGIQHTMYRARLWTMRQYAGFATAKESNARYRYLLSQGQMGLSVAFDLPTQMGMDSDAPLAAGEVGRTGVAIDTIEDMETLFESIPQDQVSVSMTINAPAAILLALYLAVARRRTVPFDKLSGTSQNDILKEYAARGTYIYPPKPSMRLVTDLMSYGAEHVPILRHQQWRTAAIRNFASDLFNLGRHDLASLRHVFLNRFRRALADFLAVQVHARHARLCGEGNENRIMRGKFAAAQSVFVLCEHDNGPALRRFVGKRGQLRRASELHIRHVRTSVKRSSLPVA